MRLKLDENLPAMLIADLVALGYDVDTVVDEGLGGQEDPNVWAAAQATQRMLATQDLGVIGDSKVRVRKPPPNA